MDPHHRLRARLWSLVFGVLSGACQLAVDVDDYNFMDRGDATTPVVEPLLPAPCDAGGCRARSLVGSLAFAPALTSRAGRLTGAIPPDPSDAPSAQRPGPPAARLIDHGFEREPMRCAELDDVLTCLSAGFRP